MKTVQYPNGELARVSNDEALQIVEVRAEAKYVPKHLWKEQQRRLKMKETTT